MKCHLYTFTFRVRQLKKHIIMILVFTLQLLLCWELGRLYFMTRKEMYTREVQYNTENAAICSAADSVTYEHDERMLSSIPSSTFMHFYIVDFYSRNCH